MLPPGVRNLFGKKYSESPRHYYECLAGEPRLFEIGVSAKW
jgi:outer membrane receptor for ferric coprogen and ferric-rhodotorulic acid